VKHRNLLFAVVCLGLLITVTAGKVQAQQDPGPRGGQAAAGSFYPGLNLTEQSLFSNSLETFMEVQSVSAALPDETGNGLGPRFNGNSCAQCHAQPAIGGSSPGPKSPQNPLPNPQVALATLDGAKNTFPHSLPQTVRCGKLVLW
jgi:mono/diheme cytochrome c family protein